MSKTETENFYSLERMVLANRHFEEDRPLLKAFNHTNISHVIEMLNGEISELNGLDKSGYFSVLENREDYRQQEVADIVLFALTAYDKVALEPSESRIWQRSSEFASLLEINVVTESTVLQEVPLFIDVQATQNYEVLKRMINQERVALDATLEVDFADEAKKNKLIQWHLDEIMAISFCLYYLMGLHPGRAVLEKVARNMLKYQAQWFTQELLDTATGDTLSQVYATQAKIAKDSWDGAVDEQTGNRPGTGTADFYGYYKA